MTEEEVKKELEDNERIMLKCVCDTLSNYNIHVRECLADFVATLCDIEKDKMFTDTKDHDIAQARALYWYAYRYMTGETYKQIGKLSKDVYGKNFSTFGVSSGVNKMYTLIEEQPIWRKRWTILKRIIKMQNAMSVEPNIPRTITIPKNVELIIKKE